MNRHSFRFKIKTDAGDKVITAKAKVRRGPRNVHLTLTAADVRNSMRLGGVGNTQTCSMAVCAKRSAGEFPHKVEGYIDWQYGRAYVVSKVSRATGLPIECYVYRHSDDIAKVNDTKGGQAKLLADLEKNGDRKIHLYVPQIRDNSHQRPRGQKTGARTSKPAPRGANLRFAIAQLGGVAA